MTDATIGGRGAFDLEELAEWRDALVGGALPTPDNDRWQQLRAGVVNMWEFETAEYWFARGHAQLHGTNESGKTTLMALTTLILLSANTSPSYIDTIGSTRSFRYYLQPTGDSDRREAIKGLTMGWSWLEFGRIAPSGPEFYTVLLFAQVRPSDSQPSLTWITVRGGRIRREMELCVGGSVSTPRVLKEQFPALDVHRTGVEYRAAVAAELYGAGTADLATTVRLLTTLRTPKLGEKLNADFVSKQIRAALPPLDDSEIKKLAEGWDELDRLNRDTGNAKEAAETITGFSRTYWRPWATAATRRGADRLRKAVTDFDDITRDTQDLESRQASRTQQHADFVEGKSLLRQQRALAQADHQGLLDSQRYRDAATASVNADHLHIQAKTARENAVAAAERADRLDTQAGESRQQAELAADAHRRALSAADVSRTGLSGELDRLGVAASGLDDGDLPRVAVAVDQRRSALRELSRLFAVEADRQNRHEQATIDLQDEQQLVAAASAAAAAARAAAEEAADQLTRDLDRWAAHLDPAPARTVTDRWAAAISDAYDNPGTVPNLAALVEADWAGPRRRELSEQVGVAERRRAALREQAAELRERIRVLEGATGPVVAAPAGWSRRARPDPGDQGMPLWRAVEVADGIAASTVAHLEAALAAGGLLDAWVTVDGAWLAERDGNDVVAVIGESPVGGSSLASILHPAADSGPLHSTVATLLASLAFVADDSPLPEDALAAFAADGRFRTGSQHGRADPIGSESVLLGEANRAAARQRELDAARAELTNTELALSALDGQISAWEQAIAAVADRVAARPAERDLISVVVSAHQSEQEQARAERRLDRAQDAEVAALRELDNARAARVRKGDELHVASHLDSDALAVQIGDLHALRGQIQAYDQTRQRADDLGIASERAAKAATSLEESAGIEGGNAARSDEEATQAETRAAAAIAAVGKDHAAVLAEEHQQAEAIAGFDQQIGEIVEAIATAKADLDQITVALAAIGPKGVEATEARSAALRYFWVVVAAGLPASLLPARRGEPVVEIPTERHLTAGISLARGLARHFTPANWPTNPAEQEREQSRLFTRMVAQMHDLRSRLEPRGISMRDIEPDINSPGGVVVVVDEAGRELAPPAAVAALEETNRRLEAAYDEQLQRNLTQLLGSAFVEHLQDRLVSARRLIAEINRILSSHPTGTTRTMLRLAPKPVDADRTASEVLRTLASGYRTLGDAAQDQVRVFLQARVTAAREEATSFGDENWLERLRFTLDYRNWEDIVVERRSGAGSWAPLSRRRHDEMSGGARAVTLMAPLVAALAATYAAMPGCPRPLWLDEAFDGVDEGNRTEVLAMLAEFDMDWLLAGPNRVVAVSTVDAAAIWEVVRAPHPEPGADLLVELWAGKVLRPLDLPDPAPGGGDPLGGLFATDRS